MTVAEAVERCHALLDEGRFEEGLNLLIEASYKHSDPALEDEIASLYEERAWTRCEDRSLADTPSYEPEPEWAVGPRSNKLALEDFEEALSWAEFPRALAGKAFLLLEGDPDAAERLLRTAVELDPKCEVGAAITARLHLRRGEWARAVEAALRAIELAPRYPAARHALAQGLKGEGRRDEALEALSRAAAEMPYNPGLLIGWAAALEESGQREKAAAIWRRATEVDRRREEAWRGLSRCSPSDVERERALAEAERLERR